MEQTIFRNLFGDGPKARVLDFFLDNQEFDYCMSEVMKAEKLCAATLTPIWDDLIWRGMIVRTRKLGNGERYKLNKENPIVKYLITLDFSLIDEKLANQSSKQ